jgi:hypothetical protein
MSNKTPSTYGLSIDDALDYGWGGGKIVSRLRSAYGYGAALDAADRIEELEEQAKDLCECILAAQKNARLDALEEAARVADELGKLNDRHAESDFNPDYVAGCAAGAYGVAAHIRALKEKTNE